jgi:5-methylcytosine-specific restriction endonuclease McrA
MHEQLSLLSAPQKRCTKCGEAKPLDAYRKGQRGKTGKDGRRQPCRACEYLAHRAYVEANREAWRDARRDYYQEYARANAERRAQQARERYATDPVQHERILENGRRQKERDPRRIAQREQEKLRKKHAPEARRASQRRKNQARRARLRKAKMRDYIDAFVVLERTDGVCGICGEDVDPMNFHVDHIYPLVLGGEHSYANTQPAHPLCNLRKGIHA